MATAVAESLSRIFGLLEAFKSFDSDSDGLITAAELSALLASLGIEESGQDLNQLLVQGDRGGNGNGNGGQLSAEEFLMSQTSDMDLSEVTSLLDAALQISQGEALLGQELCQALEEKGELSSEDCKSVAEAMDVDGDEIIAVEDILLLLNALT